MGRGVCTFSISRAMALASYTPTQIGRMAWPCTSFSTTMGMFVTGSIIRPRIFISTSMEASLGSHHVLTHQAVRRRSCHMNLNVGSQKFFREGSEICQAIRTGISRIGLCLSWETHDDVRGNGNGPLCPANHGDFLEILIPSVGALH